MTILKQPVRHWHCPSCGLRDRTANGETNRFHPCPAVGGVNLPLCEVANQDANANARHVPVMREDYIGTSNIGLVLPVSAIRTERADGSNDITILAPTASAGVNGVNP